MAGEDPDAARRIDVPAPVVLPPTTYDEFARARPERVEDGYDREYTQVTGEVGPTDAEPGRVWFAKTFYDGEGTTGVGGLGYVDITAKRVELYSSPEIADWSASAIHAEADAVWVGLVGHGEWGDVAGGLLRFDRQSHSMRTFALRDVIADIARVGDRLVLATNFGVAVLDGERLDRYFVDRTTDGRRRIGKAEK